MNLEELVLGITQFLFGTQCSKSVLCFFSVASRHLWFDTRRSPVAAASGPLAVQTTTWREWRIAAQLQKKVARPWLENEFLGMLNAKKTGIHRQYVQLYTYNIECTIIYIYTHVHTHTTYMSMSFHVNIYLYGGWYIRSLLSMLNYFQKNPNDHTNINSYCQQQGQK